MIDALTIENSLNDYYYLHQHPELSSLEFGTKRYLAKKIAEMGLVAIPCADTGLVVRLENGPGPTIGYRADIDALPITEQTELPYASVVTTTTADEVGS